MCSVALCEEPPLSGPCRKAMRDGHARLGWKQALAATIPSSSSFTASLRTLPCCNLRLCCALSPVAMCGVPGARAAHSNGTAGTPQPFCRIGRARQRPTGGRCRMLFATRRAERFRQQCLHHGWQCFSLVGEWTFTSTSGARDQQLGAVTMCAGRASHRGPPAAVPTSDRLPQPRQRRRCCRLEHRRPRLGGGRRIPELDASRCRGKGLREHAPPKRHWCGAGPGCATVWASRREGTWILLAGGRERRW
mmetsp:Transcript_112824/g.329726  ORF Transcript_112824/g.329726 Transcript_112824/m.329726 type:complete len:249 (+) Transcript_112824:937-1683(+)